MTEARKVDLTRVRAYGDDLDDGQVQTSFSLPVPYGDEANEAAKQLAMKMGLEEPMIYHSHDLGEGYTFFIVYGKCRHSVDFTRIEVPKITSKRRSFYAINQEIEDTFGRKLRIIGGCTGTDAHTVGIDAIMNMKGYAGEYGLERYPWVEAWNLGSQVSNERMLREAVGFQADAILVSQVVTQKGVHRNNLAELIDMAEAEQIRDKILFIAGGPRISHEMALELGFDAGFGPGTLAPDVASYVVDELNARTQETVENA